MPNPIAARIIVPQACSKQQRKRTFTKLVRNLGALAPKQGNLPIHAHPRLPLPKQSLIQGANHRASPNWTIPVIIFIDR